MREAFINHVWKFQYFDNQILTTSDGELISVLNRGFTNSDSGPDISNARVRIGDIEWFGNIEIHQRSSDWYQHGHEKDRAYDNVILHLVWEHDKPVFRRGGEEIPCLELRSRVDEKVLFNYNALIHKVSAPIACAERFDKVPVLTKSVMIDYALMNRLERKAEDVLALWTQTGHDWEETAWRLLVRNFGFKVNAEVMQLLAEALPLKYLLKHSNNSNQLEAMLFGVAGFLEELKPDGDDYQRLLLQEYKLLEHKFSLKDGALHQAQWKFLRMRPHNFPTVRLAELAALIRNIHHLFSVFISIDRIEDVKRFLQKEMSPYWQKHYHFGKKSAKLNYRIGQDSIENILINTIVPLQVAYAKYKKDEALMDNAIHLLEKCEPENNKIIREWLGMGLQLTNAAETQGAIEWMNVFCKPKKCLSCKAGAFLLKPY